MADAALQNAMRRFNEIGAEIGELGRRISALKEEQERIGKFIEAWHEFAGVSVHTDANDVIEPPSETLKIVRKEVAKRATGNPKKELVVEAVREIIRERMEPVSRSDLFKALTERGIILQGADPQMVLSTMLWRMRDRVARVKGGGYWLAEVPNALAGYDPGAVHTGVAHALNTPAEEIDAPLDEDAE
jgi:hypothetical protein